MRLTLLTAAHGLVVVPAFGYNSFHQLGVDTGIVTNHIDVVYDYDTRTDTVTWVTTEAATTITVPTMPGFTPAASAQSTSPSNQQRRRSVRPQRRSGSSFQSRRGLKSRPKSGSKMSRDDETVIPHDVAARAYVEEASVSTFTRYTTVGETVTSTLQASTATVYAACMLPENQVSALGGNRVERLFDFAAAPMGSSYGYSGDGLGGTGWVSTSAATQRTLGLDKTVYTYNGVSDQFVGFSHSGDQSSIQSASGCCNAALAAGCSGWGLHGYSDTPSPRYCTCLAPDSGNGWMFITNGGGSGTVVTNTVGNGQSGVPYFGGVGYFSSS